MHCNREVNARIFGHTVGPVQLLGGDVKPPHEFDALYKLLTALASETEDHSASMLGHIDDSGSTLIYRMPHWLYGELAANMPSCMRTAACEYCVLSSESLRSRLAHAPAASAVACMNASIMPSEEAHLHNAEAMLSLSLHLYSCQAYDSSVQMQIEANSSAKGVVTVVPCPVFSTSHVGPMA